MREDGFSDRCILYYSKEAGAKKEKGFRGTRHVTQKMEL